MDRLFRRQLDAIARNRTAGAAELALDAVTALQAWLCRHPNPSRTDLFAVARGVWGAGHRMAPMLRLANEIALAMDARAPSEALKRSAAKFHQLLLRAPSQIADRFFRALRRKTRLRIVTYSYSSTVIRALLRARSKIAQVFCSEGRPACEGRATARRLAQARIPVHFSTDAVLLQGLLPTDLIVLGADAVFADGFMNKVGTAALVRSALEQTRSVWVLADTSKFVPLSRLPLFVSFGPSGNEARIWRRPPHRVQVFDFTFGPANASPGLLFLTERGWMTPARVRRELRKLHIAPRWKLLGAPSRTDGQ